MLNINNNQPQIDNSNNLPSNNGPPEKPGAKKAISDVAKSSLEGLSSEKQTPAHASICNTVAADQEALDGAIEALEQLGSISGGKESARKPLFTHNDKLARFLNGESDSVGLISPSKAKVPLEKLVFAGFEGPKGEIYLAHGLDKRRKELEKQGIKPSFSLDDRAIEYSKIKQGLSKRESEKFQKDVEKIIQRYEEARRGLAPTAKQIVIIKSKDSEEVSSGTKSQRAAARERASQAFLDKAIDIQRLTMLLLDKRALEQGNKTEYNKHQLEKRVDEEIAGKAKATANKANAIAYKIQNEQVVRVKSESIRQQSNEQSSRRDHRHVEEHESTAISIGGGGNSIAHEENVYVEGPKGKEQIHHSYQAFTEPYLDQQVKGICQLWRSSINPGNLAQSKARAE